MSKPKKPFSTPRRSDSKTYQVTLNTSCGLPVRVCREWQRQSFQKLPGELAQFRQPKTKAAAQAGAVALNEYLKKSTEQPNTAYVPVDDITVGAWLEKFTRIETSPRMARNALKNRPYSVGTLSTYKGYYDCHIKDDTIAGLKMSEIEENDILEYSARLSVKKKLNSENTFGGTRTYAGVIILMRMAFSEYQRTRRRWFNPFQYIEKPALPKNRIDRLEEDEVVKLFAPGVLETTMELAVCAAMFLSGLRRAEIAALRKR